MKLGVSNDQYIENVKKAGPSGVIVSEDFWRRLPIVIKMQMQVMGEEHYKIVGHRIIFSCSRKTQRKIRIRIKDAETSGYVL